jgi:hypothetical protein
MAALQRKVVGQAVAHKVGEYVRPDGSRFDVAEGDVFDLVEGLEKSSWFTKVDPEAKPKSYAKAVAIDPPGAGPKRGSKVKLDPTGEEIA